MYVCAGIAQWSAPFITPVDLPAWLLLLLPLLPACRCVVCQCKFEGDEVLKLLPSCGHVYHEECIDQWLAGSKVRRPGSGEEGHLQCAPLGATPYFVCLCVCPADLSVDVCRRMHRLAVAGVG